MDVKLTNDVIFYIKKKLFSKHNLNQIAKRYLKCTTSLCSLNFWYSVLPKYTQKNETYTKYTLLRKY